MRFFVSLSLVAFVLVVFLPGVAPAASTDSGMDLARGITGKFTRGLTNSAFGWTSYGTELQKNGAAGIASVTSESIRRTIYGGIELGTFVLPNPQGDGSFDYGPLMANYKKPDSPSYRNDRHATYLR